MIFKSYLLEENLKLSEKQKLFLFYGENQGLKKEFKEKIKKENKSLEIINLFQDEILKNKDILLNEIINKSLFGNKKLIFINEASDKVINFIEEASKYLDDDKIIIFSEILEKKSKLRIFFEKSKYYGVCACYKDNEITIRKLILKKLRDYKNVTNDMINLIMQNTEMNRYKLNNEIDKIKTCFVNKELNINKIESLLNIQTNEDFNALKDEALNGNKINTNRLLADTVFEVENNVFYLNQINQRINKLLEIEILKKNSSNIEKILSEVKPPIFWKDKPIITNQLSKWNKKKLKDALKKTYDVEIKIKSNSSLNNTLILKKLIVDLCNDANLA